MKRAFALFLTSTLVWTLIFGIGIIYSTITNNESPAHSSFILGGFMAICFEVVVINGVFIKNTLLSLLLATIHSSSIFAVILPRTQWNTAGYSAASAGGVLMITSALYFLYRLKSNSRNNINSLHLLQAFLKTWVTKQPKDLEDYFQLYSKNETVETKVISFLHRNRKVTLVVPGVHPGPFYPVGSYNLSETLYQKLKTDGSIPMILHGAGGHERNLPRNEYTELYASKVHEFVSSLETNQSNGFRGPARRKFGVTTATNLVFGTEILMMMSRAPYNSDDLNPNLIRDAVTAAEEYEFALTLVDAHNSIGGENTAPERIVKGDWTALFSSLKSGKPQDFKLGYAHSSEISFAHGSDISEGGIGVLLLQTGSSKSILIVADSNNVKVGLREKLAEVLEKRGAELIELCTSDTHNLAARGLISRGYYALGEATQINDIVEVVLKLTAISEERLDSCKYATADFSIELPMIGTESLGDFASLTNSAIEYAKGYLKKVIPLFMLVLGITLFY